MYTIMVGTETTRKDGFSVTIGGFLGSAISADTLEKLRGVEMGISTKTQRFALKIVILIRRPQGRPANLVISLSSLPTSRFILKN